MDLHLDIEKPPPSDPHPDPTSDPTSHIRRLTDPAVISAVSEVAQARAVLKTLGPRPDHETVEKAKSKISEIEADLSRRLEEIVRSSRPSEIDRLEWRAHLAGKEKEVREAAERERQMYQAVLSVDEMHGAYERLVREAEEKLERIYEAGARAGEGEVADEGDDEVVGVLREAVGKGIERVDLSGRKLRLIPEAFGRVRGLVVLNLSSNQLESIPDSIGGLENLEELNLASNLLESLPDTIGLLLNLKILDVSGNHLVALPDSICKCRSLVELDASFNKVTYLPTNIGYELANLKRLSVQLNKIRSLPSSIGEMRSLQILDVHFNELCGLPLSIGRLTNLEILNLSSNFSDLTELPDTIGDLTNLKELDLSNNQIHALPDTFGRLDNLTKLNLEENPIVIPPKEIVNEGVEAVKVYMAKRWLDILVEEERRSMLQVQEQTQVGLLTRSTSWLKTVVSGVSGYLGTLGKSPIDPYLDQQL